MRVRGLGDPEVGDLDPPVLHQDVAGLDVPVDDAGRVRGGEAGGGVGTDARGLLG